MVNFRVKTGPFTNETLIKRKTYVLIRDDLDILYMSSGFENLSENFLRHSRIQSANI